TMSDMLMKKGKTSELTQLLKNVDLSKGAIKHLGIKTNLVVVKEKKKTGMKLSATGGEPPRTTIEEALKAIEEKYQINKEDAIIIKEICEDISNKEEIKQRKATP